MVSNSRGRKRNCRDESEKGGDRGIRTLKGRLRGEGLIWDLNHSGPRKIAHLTPRRIVKWKRSGNEIGN